MKVGGKGWVLAVGLVLAGVGMAAPSAGAQAPPPIGPIDVPDLPNGAVIDGEYVVMLEPSDPGDSWLESVENHDLHDRVEAVMDTVSEARSDHQRGDSGDAADEVVAEFAIIDGFAARLSPESAELLAQLPGVVGVYPNRVITLDDPIADPTGDVNAARVYTDPPWGVDRIDQKSLPLDGTFAASNDGAGVHVYIHDTGVWAAHDEFERGLGIGAEFVSPADSPSCYKHGTHVAGTAGGANVGIAKQSILHSVRVFNCENKTTPWVLLGGLNWILENYELPAVLNMSWGSGLDDGSELDFGVGGAVEHLAELGVVPVAAAGNNSDDFCLGAPANISQAITVAASDADDKATAFSNSGPCVDLYAPGFRVLSAGTGGRNDYITLIGTSMSAPHVAGVAATYLHDYPEATSEQVQAAIVGAATANQLTDVPAGTSNLLLNLEALPPPTTDGQLYPTPAIAPFDSEVSYGSKTVIDGSASVDPNGTALRYEWTVDDSLTVVGTEPTFEFVGDQQGWHVIHLTVTNGADKTSTAYARIRVGPSTELMPPVADFEPGVDQRVEVGTKLRFDGYASNDPDGGTLTYEWRSTGVPDIASQKSYYTRTFAEPGSFDVELTVVDDEGERATKKINVFVAAPPIAEFAPGVDRYVPTGTELRFDGSASRDPDGGKLDYEWRSTGMPDVVSWTDSFSRKFNKPGRFGVELTVIDNEGQESKKHINVWVTEPALPVASFTPAADQVVLVGQSLHFDGAASNDPDGGELDYEWRATGLGVVSRTNSYSRTFNSLGRVGIELVVTDDEDQQSRKHINVWVIEPAPPVATFTPGVDQTVLVGESLSFDGSGSFDPDGGRLRYEWRATGLGVVSRANSYSHTFSTRGRIGVELTVIDDEGDVARKHIDVWVK